MQQQLGSIAGFNAWLIGRRGMAFVHAMVLALGGFTSTAVHAQDTPPAEKDQAPPAGVPAAQPVTETKDAAPEPAAAKTPSTNDKPGSELFVNAAAALKRAQSITFRIKSRGTGQMEQYSANVEAQVRMLRDPSASGQTNGWMVRSTGSGIPKPDAERMQFDAAWLGTPIEFVSHADRKVIERRSSREAKSPAYAIANSARLQEMFAARPFNRELTPAAEYKVLEQQTIGGVTCDVVEVTFGERKGKSVWAFGADDHLPRRFESVIDNQMMSGSTIAEIEGLELDESRPPKLSKSSLRVEVPEGYTEDRPAKPAPVKPVVPTTPQIPEVTEKKSDSGEPAMKETDPMTPLAKPALPEAPTTPEIKDAVVPEATASPVPVAEPAAKAPPALEQGPDFELRSSAGGKQTLAALKGQVVVIEFGGSWCLSCRESRVELDQYVQQLSGKPVKVLGLSVRDKAPEAALERFKDQNHQFPLLIEADAVASAYHVRTYPTYYVLGFNHEVVKVEQGYTKTQTLANLSAAIEQYLASHPVPTAGSN